MSAELTSLIIVNYNTKHLTCRLIKSIREFHALDEIEIILVDNGSSDNSTQFLKKAYPEINLISNQKNLGFAKAVNRAARSARGEYLWILNSDCRLKMPVLGRLIETLEKMPDAAAVTPKTINSKGEFHSVSRNFPNYHNIIFSRGSFLSSLPFLQKHSRMYTLPDYEEITRVDAIAGTAMLVKRDVFLNIGGFDERFFMYFEDTDLCRRFSLEGKFCYYDPGALIIHNFQGSSSSRRIRRLITHHISAFEYFLKWYPQKWLLNSGLFFLLTINLIFQIILTYVGLFTDNRS